jgi:hypothetical protein
MPKKPLKTIKETPTGRNVRSINLANLTPAENRELIKKAEKGKLPNYHVVHPEGAKKFLRSNPDKKRKNNLDPMIGKGRRK